MPARLSAFVIWAVVAAIVAFWGMRLTAQGPHAPVHAVPVAMALTTQGDLTRVLGAPPAATADAPPAPPEIAARFLLTGIMAAKPPATDGYALITVDGKLPRAFAVGAALDEDLVLQSVSPRSAVIGPADGPAVATLELPLAAPAATGSLPPPARLGSRMSRQAAPSAPAAPPASIAPRVVQPPMYPSAPGGPQPERGVEVE